MKLFGLNIDIKVSMYNLFTWLLALMLFVSTTGVTVSSFACVKPLGKSGLSCQACKKAQTGRKSCCTSVAKYIGVKSAFGKPASSSFNQSSIHLPVQVLNSIVLQGPVNSAKIVRNDSPPGTSMEECARLSTFRV
jgi:hypothetical protein